MPDKHELGASAWKVVLAVVLLLAVYKAVEPRWRVVVRNTSKWPVEIDVSVNGTKRIFYGRLLPSEERLSTFGFWDNGAYEVRLRYGSGREVQGELGYLDWQLSERLDTLEVGASDVRFAGRVHGIGGAWLAARDSIKSQLSGSTP
jgi:hypothetical protein